MTDWRKAASQLLSAQASDEPESFFGIRIHPKSLAKITESSAIPDPKFKKKRFGANPGRILGQILQQNILIFEIINVNLPL